MPGLLLGNIRAYTGYCPNDDPGPSQSFPNAPNTGSEKLGPGTAGSCFRTRFSMARALCAFLTILGEKNRLAKCCRYLENK